MDKKRVVLGMSGGTDSSASAVILQKLGFEVIGITFIFSRLDEQNKRNINDAKSLAKQLQIEHHVVDLREEFECKIVHRFIQEYKSGKTPFPCAFCNPEVKFHHLHKIALKFDCQNIATGHYVSVAEKDGHKYIAKGKDLEKDQSFFLWGLKQEIINKLIFPLGTKEKSEVRSFMANEGLKQMSAKKDSMGICFIEGNDYRSFLKNRDLDSVPGKFVDKNGQVFGYHRGICYYTIGQRRGLGLNLNKPVFVSKIKVRENEIELSDYKSLYKNVIYIDDINFTNKKEVKSSNIYTVKIRYREQNNSCKIKIIDDNHAKIQLLEPVAMVANGQTAVIYDEDRVIGGGFIQSSE